MWVRGGLVLVVLWLRNVVVLLTNGWDGSGDGWSLVLVVIVVGRGSGTLDWCGTAITLESWVVPSLIIRSIVELVGCVILIDVVALGLGWLILRLNRLRDRLWWCWRGDGQVIAGGLESKRGRKISLIVGGVHYANAFTLQFLQARARCVVAAREIYWLELHAHRDSVCDAVEQSLIVAVHYIFFFHWKRFPTKLTKQPFRHAWAGSSCSVGTNCPAKVLRIAQ